MRLKNSTEKYGLITILIHWLSAVVVLGLFILGLIMVDLGYYDKGYKLYPFIHKSIGILLLMVTIIRIAWLLISRPPKALPQAKALHIIALVTHKMIYLSLLVILCSGYLIATADARAISVFDWFSVPALFAPFANQADIAGKVHLIAAWLLITLVVLHILGALKHHILDKDNTLTRMLGR